MTEGKLRTRLENTRGKHTAAYRNLQFIYFSHAFCIHTNWFCICKWIDSSVVRSLDHLLNASPCDVFINVGSKVIEREREGNMPTASCMNHSNCILNIDFFVDVYMRMCKRCDCLRKCAWLFFCSITLSTNIFVYELWYV